MYPFSLKYKYYLLLILAISLTACVNKQYKNIEKGVL